jgi:hypothetical protein
MTMAVDIKSGSELDSPAARQEPNNKDNHGYQEQYVQDAAEGLTRDQSDKPQYQQ